MKGYQFEDTQGTFHLKKAENISYLYFPIAGEAGLKSSFTPNLGGDAKIDRKILSITETAETSGAM